MSLKELDLQSSYETEGSKEHLLEDFYIPVLNEAKNTIVLLASSALRLYL